ncbi:hypothetical protein CSR02_12590 [Acetobacter pomorum]|uniref:Uncharacterized protein n=1 Tax=Acetobacter pomorum TaxID=65959 RepID=A0A2G4R9H9_9PROT|nr:hypothetical protein [Acetobacter pomorum]PHY93236.1 hypothetical protein CSR02_12590 [Acetobacter pomorum]GBR52826.1 hypothetical protein AA11825_2346 [Acetobacter pomorum DSM 11825]
MLIKKSTPPKKYIVELPIPQNILQNAYKVICSGGDPTLPKAAMWDFIQILREVGTPIIDTKDTNDTTEYADDVRKFRNYIGQLHSQLTKSVDEKIKTAKELREAKKEIAHLKSELKKKGNL